MTLHKDQDPGWWRRGMSKRGFQVVISVCVLIIVVGLIYAVANGISLF